ncbi:MAG TPA: low molecular weight protein arginine phosphatase [Actinobacteria bacterium]|nr:low molecular weight protein arginine phosphatase [Actinomycetota bacterium]
MPQTGPTVFVCTGNRCRSPMAEHLARHLDPAGSYTSAGTAARPGAPPTDAAVRALAELGIDLSGHRARSVWTLAEPGRLLVATEAHRELLRRRRAAWSDRIELLDPDGDLPDPYGGPDARYRELRDRLVEVLTTRLRGSTLR